MISKYVLTMSDREAKLIEKSHATKKAAEARTAAHRAELAKQQQIRSDARYDLLTCSSA